MTGASFPRLLALIQFDRPLDGDANDHTCDIIPASIDLFPAVFLGFDYRFSSLLCACLGGPNIHAPISVGKVLSLAP